MPRGINEWIVQWVENRVTGLAFTFAMLCPEMRDRIVAAADHGGPRQAQLEGFDLHANV